MKKLVVLATMVMGISFGATCQVNPHAIGLRGGSGTYGTGAELSYQHGLGDANRLELDLGIRSSSNHSHFVLSGIYHWAWNITSGFNWYIGPGAQLGSYNHKNNNDEDGVTLAVGGQVGIEFDFNEVGVPLLLSLDTRPMFGFLGSSSGNGYGGALGLRYTF